MSGDARPTALLLVRNGVTHDARVLRAAGVLRASGYAVTIIGSVTTQSPLARETIDGHQVLRVRARSPIGVLTRVLGRLPGPLARLHRTLTAADWHRRAWGSARRLQPALVHANDLNTVWTALALQRWQGAGVLYDSHELWADRNGRPEWRRWLLFSERIALRRADAVITASPGYSAELATRNRLDIVPPVVRNIPAAPVAPSGSTSVAPATAVYVGGLMPGRGLEVSIAALAHVPGFTLQLIGDGREAYVASLRDLAVRHGVSDRVKLPGAVAQDQVVAAAAGATFGLCLIEPVCRSYELTLPNKLFEYAVGGVPILGSAMPVIADTVTTHDLGLVVDLTPEAVAAGMHDLAEPERNAAARDAVRAFAATHTWQHEREHLARVYANVGAALVGSAA